MISLFEEGSIKSKILLLLSERWPLNGQKIFNEIRKGRTLSYQAVHKALNQLLSEGKVVKKGKEYSLDETWVGSIREWSSKVESSYKKNTSQSGEIANMYFDSINKLYNFVLKEFGDPNKKERLAICIFDHMWCPLPASTEQFSYFKNILRKADTYIICKGDTQFDRWIGKIYEEFGAKVKYGAGAGFKEGEVLISTDRVLQVFPSFDISKSIDKIYGDTKGLKTLNLTMLYKHLLDRKTKIYAVMNWNKGLAKEMAREALALFNVPASKINRYFR